MVAPDEPVPLSADDVAALVRGEMPDERIEKLLSAREVRVEAEPPEAQRPQRERPEEAERPEEPMEISEEELKALSTGREVEAVNKRLEELRRDAGGDSGGTLRRR
jgi:hypothetical protein